MALTERCDIPDIATWFGQSKVVDQEGRPLAVFHYTDMGDFDMFEHTHDIGFHFGTREAAETRRSQVWPKGADEGVQERMLTAHLRILNPLRVKDGHDWCPKNVINVLELAGILTEDDAEDAYGEVIDQHWVKETIARHGYDGLVYANRTEGGGDSWIALSADQILIIGRSAEL